MRPLRLDLEGFGTFRDPTTLDFSDIDYFALVGPTGSGKTTVIDALCFALYGAVPRWPRKSQVSLAMAPTTSATRVVLTFDVGGRRYAALRSLARSARGQVTTKQSRLISLPLDESLDGPLERLLEAEQESLAEAPADMDTAVERILGLSYEHFTQTVVLPQGSFAQFLHAEKSKRQDLLVSLLGLGVYERVMKRANVLADESATRAATLSDEQASYSDATPDAEATAGQQLRQLRGFQEGLPALLAEWLRAKRLLAEQEAASAGQEADIAALGIAGSAAVENAAEAQSLAAERATTTERLKAEEAASRRADINDEQAEAASAKAGPSSQWQTLVGLHNRRAVLETDKQTVVAELKEAATQLQRATASLGLAETATQAAGETLDQIRAAHQADALAATLTPGEPCPVCLQVVAVLPARPVHARLAEAELNLNTSQETAKSARAAVQQAQRRHDRATDELARLDTDITEVEEQLAGQRDSTGASAGLAIALQAEADLKDARAAVRIARAASQNARQSAQDVNDRWFATGRLLIETREGVIRLQPPKTTGDHVADWVTLATWTQETTRRLLAEAEAARTARAYAAKYEARHQVAVLEALHGQGVEPPATFSEISVNTAVATAVATAAHDLARIKERRKSAARLGRQIKKHAKSEALHRELGNLLRANNFERWLVEEALQFMMREASQTLSQLSGGQFELVIDKDQTIQVVDHNDADNQRPVQTLSGGETFQASLALALALGSQISALSSGGGKLDTILLDEGFGTLDPSTLDVVASTLEQLAGAGDRTVGLVTHVAALAERVPVRFEVRREGSRSSLEKVYA